MWGKGKECLAKRSVGYRSANTTKSIKMCPKNKIHNNVENVKGKVVHVVTSAPSLEDFLRSEGLALYAFLPSPVETCEWSPSHMATLPSEKDPPVSI
jgi:hypothetical protein